MELSYSNTYLGFVSSLRASGSLAIISLIAEKNGIKFQHLNSEEKVFVTAKGRYEQNDLYELKEINENTRNGDGNMAPWVTNKVTLKSKIHVFRYRKKCDYIDLEQIPLTMSKGNRLNISKFVLQEWEDPRIFYGFFKKVNGNIEAQQNTYVHTYIVENWKDYVCTLNDETTILINDDLGEPQSEIDCSSTSQLVNWLKEKTKNVLGLTKKDIDLIKSIINLETLSIGNLDSVRYERIKKAAAHISEDFSLIDFFINNKDSELCSTLHKEIDNYKERVKKEMKEEFEQEMTKKRQEILSCVENECKNKKKDIDSLDKEIEEKKKNIEGLNKNYDAILNTLKVSLPILEERKLNSNEEIQKKIQSSIYFSCEDKAVVTDANPAILVCMRNLKGSMDDISLNKIVTKVGRILSTKKACFIPCINWAYIYAKAVQRSRIWVMHVEYDWLHYEDFCKKGLIEIWNYANGHQDENCVLVLDSINITQPESGLKPLLDVINDKSPVLLNANYGYPENLKIFATVLQSGEADLPGLKMVESSFTNWDSFGNPEENESFLQLNNYFLKNDGDKSYIPIQDLIEYFELGSTDANEKNKYLGTS